MTWYDKTCHHAAGTGFCSKSEIMHFFLWGLLKEKALEDLKSSSQLIRPSWNELAGVKIMGKFPLNVRCQCCTAFHFTAHLYCLETVISVKMNGWRIVSLCEQAESIKWNFYDKYKHGRTRGGKTCIYCGNREKINPEQNNFRLVSRQDCHRVFTQRDGCLMPNKALQNMLLSDTSPFRLK